MRKGPRRVLFLVGALGFAWVFASAATLLPPVGHYRGPYGYVLNHVSVPERHITDVVTAVNFDYRGFDTLGEEFILSGSVVGVLLLLRRLAHERKRSPRDRAPERDEPQLSDAVRSLALELVGPTVVFGLYVITHGQATPGGGFQGGVVLATALITIYLGGRFEMLHRLASERFFAFLEAVGVGGFGLIGLLGVAGGNAYLQNVLPLGSPGDVLSGGTVLLINIATGLAVAAGFTMLLNAFLKETLELRERGKR